MANFLAFSPISISLFLSFIILFIAFCKTSPFNSLFNITFAENKLPLLSKVIYLDSGHGGVDSGAFYKNIKEMAEISIWSK